MSTINGKSLNDVLNALRVKKTPTKEKLGKPYFDIKEYFQAFDSTIGVANYNVEYSDFSYTQTLQGQELYSVKCRISILDDDGRVVLFRECYGGYTVQHEQNTGKDVNLQNSSEFVCNTAFKNAAKKYGIFGKYEEGESSTDSSKEQTSKKPENKSSLKSEVKNFVSDGSFEKISEKNEGIVYKLMAHEMVSDSQCLEAPVNILFYPNQYSNCETEFKKYLSSLNASTKRRLRIKVSSLKEYNGIKQYVFKGFQAA